MAKQKYCITFSGVVGSSKTPIASYLSWNLGLPILNNDAIRREVTEDLPGFSQDEYVKRRDERGQRLIAKGTPFIYDASIDREWERLNEWLTDGGYRCFTISLDLSKELLQKVCKSKGYTETLRRLDKLFEEHEDFIENHRELINLQITDKDFPKRLDISLVAVKNWLGVDK